MRLHLGASFADSWENVLLPWFKGVARSPLTAKPSAIVTPSRSIAYLVRSKLLAANLSFLGLKFLSPAQLRENLSRDGKEISLREHLRLLLAIAAETVVKQGSGGQTRDASKQLVAKSIARDPDHFLRTIDQLSAAGWTIGEVNEPGLSEVSQRFERMASDCGFRFVHEADRQLEAAAAQLPPFFHRLMLLGFNGAHWPLWPLLHGAVRSSSDSVVILNHPRDEASELDETWVGTWEEVFGEAQTIPSASDTVFSSVEGSLRPEMTNETSSRTGISGKMIHFLVGRDTPEQARAIVALTAKFLQEPHSERIGILFPRPGALPRMVARLLGKARIAHNDGLAHQAPSAFDSEAWRAWLELQESPRLKVLLRFLRASNTKLFSTVALTEVERRLRERYNAVLIDDLDILREAFARQGESPERAAILAGLEKIEFLPRVGTLLDFLSQTQKIFLRLGWKQHWSEVDRLSRSWAAKLADLLPRHLYLRWLREILGTPSLQRDELGTHPYSRVHLLPYAEAEGQSWSHLILAGLTEEEWPALDGELGFVREQEIYEFNRRNRILNRQAVKRGRHGEGHWSVRPNKTLLLGSNERRQIRRRQLNNLLETAEHGIGVTANLYSDSFPSRTANPSDLFSRLYFSARGEGLSQPVLHALEKQTREWLGDWSPIDSEKVNSIKIGRTRYAYDLRRQLRPASEYEFALRAPPDRPVSLAVTNWEQAVRWPAIIWMKIFLGVEADGEDSNAWAGATGQWVHRWLAEGTGASEGSRFVPISETSEIRGRILAGAKRFHAEVQSLCQTCDRPVPDWWTSGWGNALYLADTLACKLSALSDWSALAAEWKLNSPTVIPLDSERALRVRGRIDLILGRGEKNNADLGGFPELWIVDYKTGGQRAFDLRAHKKSETPQNKLLRQLVDGRGVQLALYSLAAHALGAEDARLTLLGFDGDMEPQFGLKDAIAQKEFWRALHEMQETGSFGMLGFIHKSFGFCPAYPLATLQVDVDLLREKWALTHPALVTQTEEPQFD
ncbi:MAG TPA: PD-(D/E)XK nuclease family protein [Chthoniobacterales bacterium]|nr:PD-(D/E)XK nuclease family protein [Chthoniobacterales bacterium]